MKATIHRSSLTEKGTLNIMAGAAASVVVPLSCPVEKYSNKEFSKLKDKSKEAPKQTHSNINEPVNTTHTTKSLNPSRNRRADQETSSVKRAKDHGRYVENKNRYMNDFRTEKDSLDEILKELNKALPSSLQDKTHPNKSLIQHRCLSLDNTGKVKEKMTSRNYTTKKHYDQMTISEGKKAQDKKMNANIQIGNIKCPTLSLSSSMNNTDSVGMDSGEKKFLRLIEKVVEKSGVD